MAPIHLSVVIPAYNERKRLAPTLARVIAYLDARARPFEVIVVDDGSSDGTMEVARALLAPLGNHGRVLRREHNHGKGACVRRGMVAARGALVLFSDADLSTPIEEVEKLERAVTAGAKVAFGSRALERALVDKPQGWVRDHIGRAFNAVVQMFALRGIRDTQCGFKLFSADVVSPIFSRQRVLGFGFDVEILAIARHLGYRITEVPVRWINDVDSKLTVLQGARAFIDPLRVRLALILGHYDEPRLAPAVDERAIADQVGSSFREHE
jgi:dolichyl-phosphate beta-glucosyltransferase